MKHHRYAIDHAPDGDFIVWQSWDPGIGTKRGGRWQEHTRWLIPGTQIEEDFE